MSYCFYCMREKGEARYCPYCGRQNDARVPAHHLAPGAVLGKKYVVGYAIGEGGFGITYVGKDTTLDIKVAIKEYYPNGSVNRNTSASPEVETSSEKSMQSFMKGKADFLNEARRLARFLKVPGVVGVRDYFEANNTAYIIMDYLEGEDLSSYLSRAGRMPAERVFAMMKPIVTALRLIHEEGIIHRDISPDNIMYCTDGSLVLMDFGSARYYANSEKEMSVMLKQGFAPEEQYRKNGGQGPWTDVYGVCATMYKCITGVVPEDALDRLRQDNIRRPSELGAAITPAYESVLMYGLAVFKENRCQNMAELLKLMEQAMSGAGVPLGMVGGAAPAQMMRDRNLTYGDSFSGMPQNISSAPAQKKNRNTGLAVAITLIAIFAALAIAAVVVLSIVLGGQGDQNPTAAPTQEITESATDEPAVSPTEPRTDAPTEAPTEPPTEAPTEAPTEEPETIPPAEVPVNFDGAAASSRLGDQAGHTYNAENALRYDTSCWCEGVSGDGEGEWILFTLPVSTPVRGLEIINGYAGTEKQYTANGKPTQIRIELSDGTQMDYTLEVKSVSQRQEIQNISFGGSYSTEYIKITIISAQTGAECDDTCITYVGAYQ